MSDYMKSPRGFLGSDFRSGPKFMWMLFDRKHASQSPTSLKIGSNGYQVSFPTYVKNF